MEQLEKEIVIQDFVQLYRQSVSQRAQIEMQRQEIEKLSKENESLKSDAKKPQPEQK